MYNEVTVSDEEAARIEAEENGEGVDFDSVGSGSTKASEDLVNSMKPFLGKNDDFGNAGEGPIEDEEEPEVVDEAEEEESTEEVVDEEEQEEESDEEPETTSEAPEWLTKYLSEKNPEASFDSPESYQEYLDGIHEKADSLDKEIEANKKVYDIFEANEGLRSIVQDIASGEDEVTAILKHINVDDAMKELEETDPKKYKEVVRQQVLREEEAAKKAKEAEKFQEEFDSNVEKTGKILDEFKTEQGMNDDEFNAFQSKIDELILPFSKGLVSKELIDVFNKGINFEAEMEKAKEEGRVEGSNKKITKERKKKDGDGLPKIKSGGGVKPANKPEGSEFKRELAGAVINSQNRF